MQFLTTLLPLLLSSTLVSAVPLEKRDTTQVLSDLTTVTSDAALLSSDLESFLNGTATIKPFSRHFSSFTRHIKDVTTDVNAVGSFNSSDSEAIASQTADFAQNTLNLLESLQNNASALIAQGQKTEVLDNLDDANTAQLDMFTALENAVDPDAGFDSVSTSQNELQFAFQDTINDYSS